MIDILTLAIAKKIINTVVTELRQEIDDMSVFKFKGIKEHISDLPQTGDIGDVWHVNEDGNEYVWDGSKWEDFGGIIDLSEYSTTAEVTTMINNAISAALGDYYTKTEINTALEGKQDAGDYATNTALTEGLATKQPVGDYATNSDLTTGLASKADVATTYTKTEVDTALNGKQNTLTTGRGISISNQNEISTSALKRITVNELPSQNIDTEAIYVLQKGRMSTYEEFYIYDTEKNAFICISDQLFIVAIDGEAHTIDGKEYIKLTATYDEVNNALENNKLVYCWMVGFFLPLVFSGFEGLSHYYSAAITIEDNTGIYEIEHLPTPYQDKYDAIIHDVILATEDDLATKQDTLTAGNGINIDNNNEISTDAYRRIVVETLPTGNDIILNALYQIEGTSSLCWYSTEKEDWIYIDKEPLIITNVGDAHEIDGKEYFDLNTSYEDVYQVYTEGRQIFLYLAGILIPLTTFDFTTEDFIYSITMSNPSDYNGGNVCVTQFKESPNQYDAEYSEIVFATDVDLETKQDTLTTGDITTSLIQDEAVTKSKLSTGVQTSLDKADTALQEHQSLANYYTKSETSTLLNDYATTSYVNTEFAKKVAIAQGSANEGKILKVNSSGNLELSNDNDTTYTAGTNINIDSNNEISATDTTYSAGSNISIDANNEISAVDTTYTAGANISIDANNEISAIDTTYTAGANISIVNGEISATDTTYTAGSNISISNGEISATDTTYSAGTNVSIDANNEISVDLSGKLDANQGSTNYGKFLGIDTDGSVIPVEGGGGGGGGTYTAGDGILIGYDTISVDFASGTGSGATKVMSQADITAALSTKQPSVYIADYTVVDGTVTVYPTFADISAALTAGKTVIGKIANGPTLNLQNSSDSEITFSCVKTTGAVNEKTISYGETGSITELTLKSSNVALTNDRTHIQIVIELEETSPTSYTHYLIPNEIGVHSTDGNCYTDNNSSTTYNKPSSPAVVDTIGAFTVTEVNSGETTIQTIVQASTGTPDYYKTNVFVTEDFAYGTGQSQSKVMTQKAVTDAIAAVDAKIGNVSTAINNLEEAL